jgi:hypothetical protein
MLINIVRAVVNQVVGNCKTEVSRKPLSWMITLQALMAWRQESTYTAPTDWVWASLQKKGRQPLWLATVMRLPTTSSRQHDGRCRQENRLARLRAYVLHFDQVAGR